MPRRTRPDPRSERAHAAVLDAATDLFLEDGVAAVTVEAVAARSGVAKTTMYRRWPNRDDLLLDVFRRFTLALEVPPPDLAPEARVRQVARQLAAAFASPTWRRALPALLGAARHSQELAGLADRIDAHQRRVIRTVLQDAVAAGALPPGLDAGDALLLLLGPLLTAALMRPDALTNAFADRVAAAVFATATDDAIADETNAARAQAVLRTTP